MGFWGTILVARTGRPRRLRAVRRGFGAEADLDTQGAPGWWVTRLVGCDPLPEWGLRLLCRAGGGPLMSADIFDSDVARVRLVARGRPPVEFLLAPDVARAMGFDVDHVAQARAPQDIAAWAGVTDPEPVRRVLAAATVFAEDTVLRLAAAFGAIPADELSSWVFDDEVLPPEG